MAQARPTRRVVHGVTLHDDYAWLRADNWQEVLKKPSALPRDIRAYLEAENKYAAALLAPTQALQRKLRKELRGRIKEDDSSVPAPDGPWSYFERYREDGEHPLVCRRPRDGGRSHILLDGEKLAKGKPFFDFSGAAHSPDHTMMAWSCDDKGSEYHTIRVRDLATGKDLPDRVIDSDGDAVWTADNRAFYYARLDDNHRPSHVLRHRLGDNADKDAVVFEESDARWFINIGETQSGRFLSIDIADHETSECWLLDLRRKNATPVCIEPREHGLQYECEDHGARLFILTNADGAEDFKIVEAPLDAPGRANWRDVVSHRPGVLIDEMGVFKRHLVRVEKEDGLPRIVVRKLANGEEHTIAFDEEAYDLELGEVLEFDTDVIRFVYSSPTTPGEVWDYNMTTRERVLRKRQEIPSGHNPSDYVARRIFAISHDGERVPISLLHRKDLPLDGSAPMLLTGYGAYGHAYEANFGAHRFSLVDRGFVYAIAHVRGGTDRGWRWYQDGKLTKKANTFHDFIACARHLAALKYTSEGQIVAVGRSAGGLMMGAVANMAPEVFAGVIGGVPFVDALNTMLDETLPLTPPEWLEWGDPLRDEAAFNAIRAYSPYDNVRAQHYPAILALGGLSDPRVTYWEPAKWVARLRAHASGGGPILLKTNMQAGHGGASGRFERLGEIATEYAFALMCVKHPAAT